MRRRAWCVLLMLAGSAAAARAQVVTFDNYNFIGVIQANPLSFSVALNTDPVFWDGSGQTGPWVAVTIADSSNNSVPAVAYSEPENRLVLARSETSALRIQIDFATSFVQGTVWAVDGVASPYPGASQSDPALTPLIGPVTLTLVFVPEISDPANGLYIFDLDSITPLETIPPTITSQVSPAPNAAGWHNSSVTISYSCSDNSSLVTCPSPVVVTTEGAGQSITRTAVDAAGNQAPNTVLLNIDTTPLAFAFSGELRSTSCLAESMAM
jgi:hypothetical protein